MQHLRLTTRRATVWELLETSFLRTTLLLWVLWTFLGWGTEWTQWIPLFLAKQHFSETAQYHWLMVLNTHEMAAPVMILWAQVCAPGRGRVTLSLAERSDVGPPQGLVLVAV